ILAPDAFGRAGITAWQRLAGRTLGHLLRFTPQHYDPHVRACRVGDLERCANLLDKASAGFDWAMVWSPERLASELEDPFVDILVLERQRCVQAMVRYRRVLAYGQHPVPAAVIDLWADDGLTAPQRVRLLGHVCNHLRRNDVHVVQALRCAMMPASAF